MFRSVSFFILINLIITGCSGDDRGLAPVSGTVLFNGKPLPNAGVIFTPDQDNIRVGVGSTDKDGKYRLTSFQINDGAKIGKHTVTIRAYEIPEGPLKPLTISPMFGEKCSRLLNMPGPKLLVLLRKLLEKTM